MDSAITQASTKNWIDAERMMSAILTAALDCIVAIDHAGDIISFNHAAEVTFGYRSEDVIGRKLADIVIPPEWRERHRQGIERFLTTGKSTMLNRRIELTAMRADGSLFPIELAIVPLSVDGKPIFTAFMRDISERKRAETLQLEQTRILGMIATSAPLTEILTEITQLAERQTEGGLCTIFQLNDNMLASGIGPSLPRTYLSGLEGCAPSPSSCSCAAAVARGEAITVMDIATDPVWTTRANLALAHGLKACTSWPIFGKGTNVLGSLALYFREALTPTLADRQLGALCAKLAGIAIESHASETRIRRLAHYDGLTGLPNRFLFNEYLDLALRNARRHQKKFAVFFVDLDKFKEINDTLGHDAGDQVLREISKRLRNCLRHTDKIARMGGDEFYVLIEELNNGRDAADVAQKLLEAAARPVMIGTGEYRLSVSIGIAIYPDDGSNGTILLRNADSAMYRAKEQGKNAYRFYSSPNLRPQATTLLKHPSLLERAEKWARAN
jgi:diguanylate cyclase (GGDEF)-like protein/PAS domain S-box-containing protein